MVYSPKTWANDAAGGTPITAAELQRMEDGIQLLAGGTQGQVLQKSSSADYATTWRNPLGAGGPTFIKSGYYYDDIVGAVATTSTSSFSVNFLRCRPFYVPVAFTADRIGVELTTVGSAGAVARLGIYNAAVDGSPGTLLLDAGTVALDATPAVKEITISQALAPGLYYLASLTGVAAATLRSQSVTSSMRNLGYPAWSGGAGYALTVAQTYGALPASAPAFSPDLFAVPVIRVRAA